VRTVAQARAATVFSLAVDERLRRDGTASVFPATVGVAMPGGLASLCAAKPPYVSRSCEPWFDGEDRSTW
jgi:hypothetical protein